jgi:phage repressor protein C with HTH and peptisase S24 domain
MNYDMNVRLKSARMAAGYAKASQAVEKFKWNISTYRAHENGQNQYDAKTAAVYAEAFRTSAAWLLTGETTESQNENNIKTAISTRRHLNNQSPHLVEKNIPFLTFLGDGYWTDSSIIQDNDKLEFSPLPPDTRFKVSDQFDMKIQGSSCEPVLYDSEYIRCVKFLNHDGILADGDIVVIKRLQGNLIEYSARRVQRTAEDINFVPLSRDHSTYKSYNFHRGTILNSPQFEIIGKILFKFKIFS